MLHRQQITGLEQGSEGSALRAVRSLNIHARAFRFGQCLAYGLQLPVSMGVQKPLNEPAAVKPVQIGTPLDVISRGRLQALHDVQKLPLGLTAPEIRAAQIKPGLYIPARGHIVMLQDRISLLQHGQGRLQHGLGCGRFRRSGPGYADTYPYCQHDSRKIPHALPPFVFFLSASHYTPGSGLWEPGRLRHRPLLSYNA